MASVYPFSRTMISEVTLYDLRSDTIHVSVVARFEKEKLIIDGYDIGKRVEEIMGDSDYEYITTVDEPEMLTSYAAVGIPVRDEVHMLHWLADNFKYKFLLFSLFGFSFYSRH